MSRKKREVKRIRAKFEWIRGFNMDIPYSKYVMFCIGTSILLHSISYSFSEILDSIAKNGLL